MKYTKLHTIHYFNFNILKSHLKCLTDKNLNSSISSNEKKKNSPSFNMNC